MRLSIIIAFSVLVLLILLATIVALVGSRLPVNHIASVSIHLPDSPEHIYATIRQFDAVTRWRADVKRVEMLDPVEGRVRFREHGTNGPVTYEVVEDVPGKLLVTRIVDKDLGYSGTWTYALEEENNETRLTITEHGEVPNVIFRFASRYVFGHERTIRAYQDALARSLTAG